MDTSHPIYTVIAVVTFIQGAFSWDCQNITIAPILVWWEQKPIVFSRNKTSRDYHALEGILPDLWPTVANQCREMLSQSCLKSFKLRQVDKSLPKPIFPKAVGSRGLLMPVKLRGGRKSVLGMPFVKLLDSPGVAVIMKKATAGTNLFNAILMTWPILIFVVLSTLLSGFFMWFLEYRSNPQMFSPFCPNGVLNGFWWASVTMTTVGYGDITPKTIPGRLFTITWISAGLVILAMYMGVVTTSLATTRLEGTQHFYGITVAAVNQTEEQKFAILQNTHLKVQEDEHQVIDAVHRRKDGVKLGFIDFYIASHLSNVIREKKLQIVRTIPRKHAYGVLLGKDWPSELVDCLRSHSEDNRHVVQQLIPKYILASEHDEGLTEYFSGSSFGYFIYGLLGFLCLLIFLGFSYDRGYLRLNEKD